MLSYKGYYGQVEFDDKANIFHGEVVGLRDVVTFQGKSPFEIKKAFRESIDDYLDFCKKLGKQPDKSCSGRLLLRLDKETHRQLAIRAALQHESVNHLVRAILAESLERKPMEKVTA